MKNVSPAKNNFSIIKGIASILQVYTCYIQDMQSERAFIVGMRDKHWKWMAMRHVFLVAVLLDGLHSDGIIQRCYECPNQNSPKINSTISCHLNACVRLYITNCSIITIHKDAFLCLTMPIVLRIVDNDLYTLPVTVFRQQMNLRKLDLGCE